MKNYHANLMDLMIQGKAKPSSIVSNHIRIDQAPEAYREVYERGEVRKAIIEF